MLVPMVGNPTGETPLPSTPAVEPEWFGKWRANQDSRYESLAKIVAELRTPVDSQSSGVGANGSDPGAHAKPIKQNGSQEVGNSPDPFELIDLVSEINQHPAHVADHLRSVLREKKDTNLVRELSNSLRKLSAQTSNVPAQTPEIKGNAATPARTDSAQGIVKSLAEWRSIKAASRDPKSPDYAMATAKIRQVNLLIEAGLDPLEDLK